MLRRWIVPRTSPLASTSSSAALAVGGCGAASVEAMQQQQQKQQVRHHFSSTRCALGRWDLLPCGVSLGVYEIRNAAEQLATPKTRHLLPDEVLSRTDSSVYIYSWEKFLRKQQVEGKTQQEQHGGAAAAPQLLQHYVIDESPSMRSYKFLHPTRHAVQCAVSALPPLVTPTLTVFQNGASSAPIVRDRRGEFSIESLANRLSRRLPGGTHPTPALDLVIGALRAVNSERAAGASVSIELLTDGEFNGYDGDVNALYMADFSRIAGELVAVARDKAFSSVSMQLVGLKYDSVHQIVLLRDALLAAAKNAPCPVEVQYTALEAVAQLKQLFGDRAAVAAEHASRPSVTFVLRDAGGEQILLRGAALAQPAAAAANNSNSNKGKKSNSSAAEEAEELDLAVSATPIHLLLPPSELARAAQQSAHATSWSFVVGSGSTAGECADASSSRSPQPPLSQFDPAVDAAFVQECIAHAMAARKTASKTAIADWLRRTLLFFARTSLMSATIRQRLRAGSQDDEAVLKLFGDVASVAQSVESELAQLRDELHHELMFTSYSNDALVAARGARDELFSLYGQLQAICMAQQQQGDKSSLLKQRLQALSAALSSVDDKKRRQLERKLLRNLAIQQAQQSNSSGGAAGSGGSGDDMTGAAADEVFRRWAVVPDSLKLLSSEQHNGGAATRQLDFELVLQHTERDGAKALVRVEAANVGPLLESSSNNSGGGGGGGGGAEPWSRLHSMLGALGDNSSSSSSSDVCSFFTSPSLPPQGLLGLRVVPAAPHSSRKSSVPPGHVRVVSSSAHRARGGGCAPRSFAVKQHLEFVSQQQIQDALSHASATAAADDADAADATSRRDDAALATLRFVPLAVHPLQQAAAGHIVSSLTFRLLPAVRECLGVIATDNAGVFSDSSALVYVDVFAAFFRQHAAAATTISANNKQNDNGAAALWIFALESFRVFVGAAEPTVGHASYLYRDRYNRPREAADIVADLNDPCALQTQLASCGVGGFDAAAILLVAPAETMERAAAILRERAAKKQSNSNNNDSKSDDLSAVVSTSELLERSWARVLHMLMVEAFLQSFGETGARIKRRAEAVQKLMRACSSEAEPGPPLVVALRDSLLFRIAASPSSTESVAEVKRVATRLLHFADYLHNTNSDSNASGAARSSWNPWQIFNLLSRGDDGVIFDPPAAKQHLTRIFCGDGGFSRLDGIILAARAQAALCQKAAPSRKGAKAVTTTNNHNDDLLLEQTHRLLRVAKQLDVERDAVAKLRAEADAQQCQSGSSSKPPRRDDDDDDDGDDGTRYRSDVDAAALVEKQRAAAAAQRERYLAMLSTTAVNHSIIPPFRFSDDAQKALQSLFDSTQRGEIAAFDAFWSRLDSDVFTPTQREVYRLCCETQSDVLQNLRLLFLQLRANLPANVAPRLAFRINNNTNKLTGGLPMNAVTYPLSPVFLHPLPRREFSRTLRRTQLGLARDAPSCLVAKREREALQQQQQRAHASTELEGFMRDNVDDVLAALSHDTTGLGAAAPLLIKKLAEEHLQVAAGTRNPLAEQ